MSFPGAEQYVSFSLVIAGRDFNDDSEDAAFDELGGRGAGMDLIELNAARHEHICHTDKLGM